MAPELVGAKMMIAPKGVNLATHGPYTFQPLGKAPIGMLFRFSPLLGLRGSWSLSPKP